MSASSQRSADATAQNQARLRKHLLPQRLHFCQQPLERKSSPLENRSCWGSPWASPRRHGKAATSSGRSRGNQSRKRCPQVPAAAVPEELPAPQQSLTWDAFLAPVFQPSREVLQQTVPAAATHITGTRLLCPWSPCLLLLLGGSG